MKRRQTLSLLLLFIPALLLADETKISFDKEIYDYSYKSCLLAGEGLNNVKGHCECSANVALTFINDTKLTDAEKVLYLPIYTQTRDVDDLTDKELDIYQNISERIILDYSNKTFMNEIIRCYDEHIADYNNKLTSDKTLITNQSKEDVMDEE